MEDDNPIETVVPPRDPDSPEAVYLAASPNIPYAALNDMNAVVREQQALLDRARCQNPACVQDRTEPCVKPTC
jgi:hypothetical protein